MIKINNTEISDIKINDSSVSKVMVGSSKVWEKASQIYQLLDILYSDASGNLSVSNQVLPASEGKVPIALCIAGTNFFGQGEKARWMSLKYMNYNTPETGSLSVLGTMYGNFNNDILGINNTEITHINGSRVGWLQTASQTQDYNLIPLPFDGSGNWNLSQLGQKNQYACTNVNGKDKTEVLIETVTEQPSWETDTSIKNESFSGYAPAACCCYRYHTLGTQQGDWYLGSIGEMCTISALYSEVNSKLSQIASVYNNDCINSLYDYTYWSSDEVNNESSYYIKFNIGEIAVNVKYERFAVLAMLQY